jgi:hypothetical protein
MPNMGDVTINGDKNAAGTVRNPTGKSITIADQYEAVAASQTDQVMGATGAVGDFLARVVVSVVTAATGSVSIKDGAGSAIPLTTGAATLPLGCTTIDLGIRATGAGWSITTGAGATAIGIGNFT